MSFTQKIIDGARSGINTVMDKIAADDTPLSYVDEDSFQRELEARVAARKAAGNTAKPESNPRAQLAGSSAEAKQRRTRLAREREARIRGLREKRARAAEQAREEAFRRAKEQARRTGTAGGWQTGSGTGQRRQQSTGTSGGGRRRASGFPFQREDKKIAEYYKVLNLPYGAEFDEVKASYRKLMRKYHPDRHTGSPKKQKAATELSMRVTQAYNELEEHLKKKQ